MLGKRIWSALVMMGIIVAVTLVGASKFGCGSGMVDPRWNTMVKDAVPQLSDTWISGTSRLIVASYKENSRDTGGFNDSWIVLVDPSPQETFGAIRILGLDDFYLSPGVNSSQVNYDESAIERICRPGGDLLQLWAAIAIANHDGVLLVDREQLFDCVGQAYARYDFRWPFMTQQAMGIYSELGITDHASMSTYIQRAQEYINVARNDGEYLVSVRLMNSLNKLGHHHQYEHILSRAAAVIDEGNASLVSPKFALAWLDLAEAKKVSCEQDCRETLYRAVQAYEDRFSTIGLCQSEQGCSFSEMADVIEVLTRLDKPNEISSVKTALWRFLGFGGWVVPNWTSQTDLNSTVSGVILANILNIKNVYDETKVKRYIMNTLNDDLLNCKQIYLSLVALSYLTTGDEEIDPSLLDPDIKKVAHEAFLKASNTRFSGACVLYASSVGNKQDTDMAMRLMDERPPMDPMDPYDLMDMRAPFISSPTPS